MVKKLIFICVLFISGCSLEKEIECIDCHGSGKVTYDSSHDVVVKLGQPEGTYVCPMCNGEGKLIEEVIK